MLHIDLSCDLFSLCIKNISQINQIKVTISNLKFESKYNLFSCTSNCDFRTEESKFSFVTLPNLDGALYTWGNNQDGRLGLAQTEVILSPIPHPNVDIDTRFVEVSTSNGTNLGITNKGNIII